MSEEKISDLTEEQFVCHNCGKKLDELTEDKIYVDDFLWKIFAYLFCSQECRDNYIDSK